MGKEDREGIGGWILNGDAVGGETFTEMEIEIEGMEDDLGWALVAEAWKRTSNPCADSKTVMLLKVRVGFPTTPDLTQRCMAGEHVGEPSPGEDVPKLDSASSQRPPESSPKANGLPERIVVEVEQTQTSTCL